MQQKELMISHFHQATATRMKNKGGKLHASSLEDRGIEPYLREVTSLFDRVYYGY